MKTIVIFLILIGFVGSTLADSTIPSTKNSDTDFTAATFADKYQDLLQKGGTRVSVLIKVAGDVESTDPTKRAKEIRNLQSSTLKFLSYTNGINILSNPEKNEITGQIYPHWIEILEKRTDVLSVTILDSNDLSKDGIVLSPLKQQQNGVPPNEVKCKDGLYRGFSESNGKAICATGYTIKELIHLGWAEPHTAISSATISKAGDGIRDYCPEGTQLTQGGWYAPFTKYPNVEQVSVQELYDPEYDSQGIEFILNPLNDPETSGKTMIFVFVDCDLSFDYFEVLILPNTIEQRKNFVVHYPTTTTNTIHFDNQDDIPYKIDGRTDSGVGSGDFTVMIDPQDDWFIEETENGYEAVTYIELSASNTETGEVYDWMNYIIYLTQEIVEEPITNFEECIAAGNPAMESYPRQCRTPDGLHFVEDISTLDVIITGDKQVRRGTTQTIEIQVLRDELPIQGARVFIDIEDYGEDIIKEFDGYTNFQGNFVFSWEIPQSFDDIESLLAIVDVTDDISAKTKVFEFQVYCLAGEKDCKVDGN